MTAIDPKLGRHMHVRGMVLYGKMPSGDWQAFLRALTHALGMKPVARPGVWKYPIDGHSGGNGETVIQPITQSFLALDTWPDHDGAYLMVCSCVPFSTHSIDAIAKQYGLLSGAAFSTSLGL